MNFAHSLRYLALLGLVLIGGCNPASPPKPTTAPQPVSAGEIPSPQTQAAAVEEMQAAPLLEETWGAIFMSGSQVGHEHTTIRPLRENGRDLVEITQEHRISVQRFGDTTETGILLKSIETPAGEVVRFSTRLQTGGGSIETSGRVTGGTLEVEVASTGKTTPTRNPWPAECRGFFGIEQSLARLPLEPGGRRTLLLLDPVVNQPVTWQLTAAQKENVQLLEGSRELLRIDAVALYPGGQAMNASAWCDEKGHILKQRLAGLQEVYRTTKEKAQSTSGRKAFDLGISTLVRVARPLLNAHHTRRVRYRVEIEAGADSAAEPVKLFAAGPTQEVKRVDGHAAEIVVRSLKPGAAPESPTTDAPSEADRQPNNYIQSDDPTIVRMAAEAAGDESDPAKIALLLESYVRRAIRSVKFSQTFATAADVARSGEGDCTEHAVLLAALARAKGIPARVAIGLVYVGGATPGFGFHMWTEMFLGGVWVPLDGTLGQGGIGAAHLKLTHSNLAGGEGFASMLPVAQVLGRLKIEVLEAE